MSPTGVHISSSFPAGSNCSRMGSVTEHAVDHVALKFWEAGDEAGAAGLALGGGGQAGRVDGGELDGKRPSVDEADGVDG